MRKQYLECGKIVSTHGLRGEVKVLPWCDGPEEFQKYRTLYFDGGKTAVKVEKARPAKGMVLVKLQGIDTPEAAQSLRGRVVWMDRADDTLEEGQYYLQDLIGLTAVDADTGEEYGRISDVTGTAGANDVYHITFPDGRVQLIPAIPEVVLSIDPDAGRMVIRPLEGLFT